MKRYLWIPLVAVCLQSQAPPLSQGWKPLLSAPQEGVDLRFRLRPTPEGLVASFRNFGTQAIHFDGYFPAIQAPEDAIDQGRVHIEPGRTGGLMREAFATDPGTPTLLRIRLGDDTGAYWRE